MTVRLFSRTLPALLLPLLLGTTGCGGSSSSDAVLLPGLDPTALSATALTPENLTAALAQDKSTVAVSSGSVTYAMTLTNKTQAAVSLVVPSAADGSPLPPVSLVVTSSAGDAIYPGTAGSPAAGTGKTQTLVLQPGDFVQQTLQLSGAFRVIARYQASATFTTAGKQTIAGPLVLTAR